MHEDTLPRRCSSRSVAYSFQRHPTVADPSVTTGSTGAIAAAAATTTAVSRGSVVDGQQGYDADDCQLLSPLLISCDHLGWLMEIWFS